MGHMAQITTLPSVIETTESFILLTNPYITKSLVKQTIFFVLIIVKYTWKKTYNFILAKIFHNPLVLNCYTMYQGSTVSLN